jgi:peptide/nickel transport system permease protein
LGFSRNLNRPAAQLIAERFPLTLREIAVGLLVGWLLGLSLAVPAAVVRFWPINLLTGAVSGSLLSIPAAVLALIFVWLRWPASFAIGLLLAPKVFAYTRNLLLHAYDLPHVLTARSKGVGEVRVLLWHVIPATAPQILALAGVSVSIALGAAVPIEALCDQPGIGQLAWQAALARDLVLLVNLTLIVTLITVIANSASDMLGEGLKRSHA